MLRRLAMAAAVAGPLLVHLLQVTLGMAAPEPLSGIFVTLVQMSFFLTTGVATSSLLSEARRRLGARVWLFRLLVIGAAFASKLPLLQPPSWVPGGIPQGTSLWISVTYWPNALGWVVLGVALYHSVIDGLALALREVVPSERARRILVLLMAPVVVAMLAVAWSLPDVGAETRLVLLYALLFAGFFGTVLTLATRFATRRGREIEPLLADDTLARLAASAPEKAEPLLADAFEKGPPALKAAAIVPLARIRGAAFEGSLLPLLRDDDAGVRRAALHALSEVGTASAVAVLDAEAGRLRFSDTDDAAAAIAKIQARLVGAEAGQLSPATLDGEGRVGIAEQAAALSLAGRSTKS